jgi:hypothetical protein
VSVGTCSSAIIKFAVPSVPVYFRLWRYEWNSSGITTQLAPLAFLQLATHPSAIFVTDAVAGVVYVTDKTDEKAPEMERDDLGYLTFHVIEWKGLCRTMRRFTPLSFFGDTRATQVRDHLAHCDRTSSHFLISFETLPCVDVYLYDMHHFKTFPATQNPTIRNQALDIVHPRLKATYELNPEDGIPWYLGVIRQTWSQSCLLWDNYRMGILGFNISNEGALRKAVLSLSVINLSPLLTHDESIPTYDLQGEYKRHILDREVENLFHTTQSNRLLGNLPQYGTNNIWALRDSEAPKTLAGLALGRFYPEDEFQTPIHIKDPNETNTDGSNEVGEAATSGQRKKMVQISLGSWIPPSEQAEDLDLDDRLGRVAFGMLSGKAYILEFV